MDCGDPDDSGACSAVDALFTLRTAVALNTCDRCVCNVDGSSGPTTSTHALRKLQGAVGLEVDLICPVCN